MSLRPGDRVGPFEIVAQIGVGGMGEVYRAHDRKLDRDVAIKVLPATATADHDRLARLRREARTLAALSHPNVGVIHGLEDFAGGSALVLELVDGVTLSEAIGTRPMPLTEALRIAGQIASGVDAAHKKGIIHRDLKPANIKVTADGTVKVLDFGLAKLTERPAQISQAQTATVDGTMPGTVMGTPGYMSPEQAGGDAVDARTDVWALGCILYEMLTGRRAFEGRTASDTLAKVLNRDPDWNALPRATPAAVRELLRRCLAKDPRERIENMTGVRARLDLGFVPRATKPSPITVAVAAIAIVAGSLIGYRWLTALPAGPTDPSQWEQLTDFADAATHPAISADGRMLAFVRGEGTFATPGQLYLKHLPAGEPAALTRDGQLKMDPVFSPDGNRIAYTVTGDASSMRTTWDTWVVPVVRGEPRLWLSNSSGLTWIGANQILFSVERQGNHMGIVTSAENHSGSREVYFPAHKNAMAHRSARSPDGQWLLVAEMNELGIFTPCRLLPFDGSSSGRLVGPSAARCTNVAWSPDGRTMYFVADTGEGAHIWRQRISDGQPEQLTMGRTTQEDGLAVAPDGKSIVSSVGQQRRGIWLRDRAGERQISQEGYAFWPLLSSDGQRMAFRVSRAPASGNSETELWLADLPSGRFERLLPGRSVLQFDLSLDDGIVAAVRDADGKNRLFVASLDPREPPRALTIESGSARRGLGGKVVYVANDGAELSLFLTNVDGATPRRLSSTPAGGILGAISPDGNWISDNRRGEMTAYSLTGQAPVNILKGSVSRLRWTHDGTRALVSVQTGPGPSAFGFGRTYVLPLQPGSLLPQMPPGGFATEAAMAAWPGVEVIPYGDVGLGPSGTFAFSKITVTRNLFRIPIR